MEMRWNSGLAYAIGLLTTDGSLSKDGRHIELTSKDIDQIKTFAALLKLNNKISKKFAGGKKRQFSYRIQFGSVKLYKFLLKIGLVPNKSKVLGELNVPDKYFADFLRGCFDGDGYTYSYWDKRWKNSFMLYTGFVSASKRFLFWLQTGIKRFYGIVGAIKFERNSTFSLKFAKRESLIILDKMYYRKDLPCLGRKYSKIKLALDIIRNQAGVEKLVYSLP